MYQTYSNYRGDIKAEDEKETQHKQENTEDTEDTEEEYYDSATDTEDTEEECYDSAKNTEDTEEEYYDSETDTEDTEEEYCDSATKKFRAELSSRLSKVIIVSSHMVICKENAKTPTIENNGSQKYLQDKENNTYFSERDCILKKMYDNRSDYSAETKMLAASELSDKQKMVIEENHKEDIHNAYMALCRLYETLREEGPFTPEKDISIEHVISLLKDITCTIEFHILMIEPVEQKKFERILVWFTGFSQDLLKVYGVLCSILKTPETTHHQHTFSAVTNENGGQKEPNLKSTENEEELLRMLRNRVA
jgi:hypothetical protein